MIGTLKSSIVTHICYRDVFSSPILISELKKILALEIDDVTYFRVAIEQLKDENLIEEKNGYFVSFGRLDLIPLQSDKNAITKKLISKGQRFLSIFAKIPFVQFIGISGSLAAKNPTMDKNGLNKGRVDMDLFVISTANTMWILFLFERVFTNMYKLVFRKHFYCFNYVTDSTFLEIHNKNFYTATELHNLLPIYDNNICEEFIEANSWVRKYYKNESGKTEISKNKRSYFLRMLAPINYVCYVLFCFGRAIKRLEFSPILEISNRFNPVNKCNLKRIANSNGGYQEVIKMRFKDTLLRKFKSYYSDELLAELFPENASFDFSVQSKTDLEVDQLFEKYASS